MPTQRKARRHKMPLPLPALVTRQDFRGKIPPAGTLLSPPGGDDSNLSDIISSLPFVHSSVDPPFSVSALHFSPSAVCEQQLSL